MPRVAPVVLPHAGEDVAGQAILRILGELSRLSRDVPQGDLARQRDDLLFFFQAEDGIRGTSVTGVQTCALPISQPAPVERIASTWVSGRTLNSFSPRSRFPVHMLYIA